MKFEDGHVLWPKHVATVNNKYCATNWTWRFVCSLPCSKQPANSP